MSRYAIRPYYNRLEAGREIYDPECPKGYLVRTADYVNDKVNQHRDTQWEPMPLYVDISRVLLFMAVLQKLCQPAEYLVYNKSKRIIKKGDDVFDSRGVGWVFDSVKCLSRGADYTVVVAFAEGLQQYSLASHFGLTVELV